MCAHIHVYASISAYTFAYVRIHLYARIYAYISACTRICTHIRLAIFLKQQRRCNVPTWETAARSSDADDFRHGSLYRPAPSCTFGLVLVLEQTPPTTLPEIYNCSAKKFEICCPKIGSALPKNSACSARKFGLFCLEIPPVLPEKWRVFCLIN